MKLGTQVWALITVVVVGALVAGGYFLGVAPFLDQQKRADTERVEAEDANATLEAEIAALRVAEQKLDDYEELAERYEKLVPRTVESQRFIRTLDALAAANGVVVTELKIDAFQLYTAPAGGGGEVDELAPPPHTDPRIKSENFVIVPFSVTIEGGWAESLAFVDALQFGDRLVLFTSVGQEQTDTAYSTVVKGNMYVLIHPGDPIPGQEIVAQGGADGEASSEAAEG
ncbi:MAG: hypothetical protein EAS51_11265 [Microbacteriaceae bacterium]|nr:MAG: hypothetical protein EAS51_11265 [Microbacteriaceae bacterium]